MELQTEVVAVAVMEQMHLVLSALQDLVVQVLSSSNILTQERLQLEQV
jgi:hypothetical protein